MVYPVLTLNVLNMSIIPRKILVSTALPYANGSIHIGHMLEHIQTDIWVRFQRLRGHESYFVCADDAHGTPIMLKAKAEGISPEELIAGVAVEHTRDFNDFSISFWHKSSTLMCRNISGMEVIRVRCSHAVNFTSYFGWSSAI